jgi:hypothetical protein
MQGHKQSKADAPSLRVAKNLAAGGVIILNSVALQMNQRPRKTLDFETPADRLQRLVALSG